jgi:DNA-binding NtrC family response regulator
LSARSASILVVDDEELPLTLRKLVLEKQGFHVITARSASEAMSLLESSHVDLVLTDQLMPGGTGVELARSVKAARPELPVVLISGVNEIPPDAEVADLFISKVEGPAAMCAKITTILAKRRQPVKLDSSI